MLALERQTLGAAPAEGLPAAQSPRLSGRADPDRRLRSSLVRGPGAGLLLYAVASIFAKLEKPTRIIKVRNETHVRESIDRRGLKKILEHMINSKLGT
ncbi:hypothetical protein [Cupriavidus sp. CuC1]|uniref:hypothetical protein n=1 Tax=Cupriavidus sp. CuC1 TaxID=3373131 RepID=UPI0037CE7976